MRVEVTKLNGNFEPLRSAIAAALTCRDCRRGITPTKLAHSLGVCDECDRADRAAYRLVRQLECGDCVAEKSPSELARNLGVCDSCESVSAAEIKREETR